MKRKRAYGLFLAVAAGSALVVGPSAPAARTEPFDLFSGPGANASARPTKGGAYVGTLTPSTGLEKRIVLKVSKDGKTGGARLECAGTRIGSFRRFTISPRGRFTAKRQTGSLLTARLRGRFTSKTTAKANLYLPAVCDGVGGRITLELK